MGELVPLALFLLIGFIVWMRHSRKAMELRSGQDEGLAIDAATRTRELEERVRVLERIVTDRGYDVAAQIEALRDRPMVRHTAPEDRL
ncbi:MAG: hypothetical protein ABW203_03010 [Novosphingobium sp.]